MQTTPERSTNLGDEMESDMSMATSTVVVRGHDGLTDGERVRLLAMQLTDPGSNAAARVSEATKIVAFLLTDEALMAAAEQVDPT